MEIENIKYLVERYPVLYHMAELSAVIGIKKYGLLSTTAILDKFLAKDLNRSLIEEVVRRESLTIKAEAGIEIVIRDQKPMNESGLLRCLNGLTPRQWLLELNSFVFFWASMDRVDRLVGTRAYASRKHALLVVDTASFVKAYKGSIYLTPMNTGCTRPYPHPRDRTTISPLNEFDLAYWKRKRGKRGDHIVEVLVRHSVPDIMKFVREIQIIG